MRRYLTFAGAGYYPSGGWDDFQIALDDLDEAIAHAKDIARGIGYASWWHVVDTETMEIVAQ